MSKFYSNEIKFTFDDVSIVPAYSEVESRSEYHLDTSVKMGVNTFKLPIIASNMDTITDIKMAKKMAELGGLGIIHRYMSVEDTKERLRLWGELGMWEAKHPIALSVGSSKNAVEKERIDAILMDPNRCWDDNEVILCVDLAHGDSKHMVDSIVSLRKDYKFGGTIIAGNTATASGTGRLREAGADVVRVGIGGGSACTTRQKTGCGIPQLSSVLDCAASATIISDGGHRIPADIGKALVAGASFVMLGGMLAGTDCTPHWDEAMAHHAKSLKFGHTDELPEVSYRGMASKEAREAFSGVSKNAEGASFRTKIKPEGSTEDVVRVIMEGIYSTMSYTGCTTIEELFEKAKFARVTSSTVGENIPHFGSNTK